MGPFVSTGLYDEALASDEQCVVPASSFPLASLPSPRPSPLSPLSSLPSGGPKLPALTRSTPRSTPRSPASHSASYGRFGFRSIIIFVGALSALAALGGPGVAWARGRKARRKAAEA